MTAKPSGSINRFFDLIPAILFIAGFLVTLYRVTQNPPAGGAGLEVMAVARSLAHDGSFANPYGAAQTGPTAVVPPLYPLYLALLMRIGGTEFRYGFLMILSVICAHALHASLLPAVSGLFFGSRLPGVYAALMFIVTPAFEVMLARESIFVAISLMMFCLLAQRVTQSRLNKGTKGAVLGIVSGILVLLNPASLLFCEFWTAYLLVTRREQLGRTRFGVGFFIGLVLTCLPWTIRNYRELGGLVVVRSNPGMELYLANNPCAEASLIKNMSSGCHSATHPNVNEAEALAVKQLGEISYDREKRSAAVRWIRKNPGRFASLTVQRTLLFWFPYRDFPPANGYPVCLITFVSLFGLFDLLRNGKPIGYLILAVSLVYSCLYCFMQADMCYRYPIFWLSLLCAGNFVGRHIGKVGSGSVLSLTG